MLNLDNKKIIKIIFLISSFALIAAFFIELVLGHQPCELCLLERIPYAFAIFVILLSYKFNQYEKYFILFLILIFFIATLLSIYHLGIEQGFINESLICDLQNSSKILSKEEILKELNEIKISCKNVTFTIFGFSLTSLNIIISFLIIVTLIKIFFKYEKN